MKNKLILAGLLVMFISNLYSQQKPVTYLFVGSYTAGKPDTGIYVYTFNVKSGAVKQTGIIEHIINPSYLTLSPDGQYLYAGADTQLPDTGSVLSFKVDSKNGKLMFINRQPSEGDNPVYVAVHNNNRFLINANYTGGSVSAYQMNEDGSLRPALQVIPFEGSSIMRSRQEKAHIHAAVFSPQGDYVFLPDLGSDKIWVFRFDTTKSEPLIPVRELNVTAVPGSGPRHFTFHPNGKYAYCIEELSGMVVTYAYKDGRLDSLQRIQGYSKTQDSYGGADIHLSPDGRFLYSSNRWEDENTLAIFAVSPQTGTLTLVGHQKTYGDHPRNFTIDPTGRYLLVANMLTNNIVVFKRNMKTGLLKKKKQEIRVPAPSCLQMRRYGG
ncbi:MAG: lactonase family protein [Saprospiraceae bacterium]|nr:lactonase family protein [Candidatus Opimibacter skivensis]MBP8086147.1 lactonase family protein [Saprospiraceae bacterium]